MYDAFEELIAEHAGASTLSKEHIRLRGQTVANRLKVMEELRNQVKELRSILAEGSSAEGYLTLFDEFVRECEFALALHNVCDYLLEPGTPIVDAETMDRIQALHAAMKMKDDCLERLMAKNPA